MLTPNEHMKTIHGERLHPCEQQMKTIHGEKHYTCEACEIGFNLLNSILGQNKLQNLGYTPKSYLPLQ